MPVAKKKTTPTAKAITQKIGTAKITSKKPVAKAFAAKQKSSSTLAAVKIPRPNAMPHTAQSHDRIPPAVQALLDRSDINQTVTNFARGLDRLDETLLRSTFHPDATLDLGPGMFQGTSNDYVHWILGALHGVKSSHHQIGQIRIELEGDSAAVETYVTIHFRLDKPTGREDVFMGARYLDRMERRPSGTHGVWKIIHRKQIIDWVRTEAVSDIFYHQNPDALWSFRTKTDPSTQMAQFPGSPQGGKLPAFLGRRYESKSVKF